LLNDAKKNVRKSQEYKDLTAKATSAGQSQSTNPKPRQGANTQNQSNQSNQSSPQPLFDQRNISTASAPQARNYTKNRVITYDYLKMQLQSISRNGYASKGLNDLADKAGTSSLVFLRKQLDFYSSSDPKERTIIVQWKNYLDALINRQSSSALPGQANYEYAMAPSAATYNPRAPGAWLMAELFPTAV